MTRLASDAEYICHCSGVIAASVAAEYSIPERMKTFPINGVTHAPTALKDCAKIQAALGRLRRTKNRNIWVRGHFQNALPAGHHKQREQKKTVRANRSSGNKEECSDGAGSQAYQNAFSISDSLHQPTRGQCRKEIATEKCCLNQ